MSINTTYGFTTPSHANTMKLESDARESVTSNLTHARKGLNSNHGQYALTNRNRISNLAVSKAINLVVDSIGYYDDLLGEV